LIFLTVGNWHKGFDRLVRAVDELAENGVITDQVIGQTGQGAYKAKYMKVLEFCSPTEFRQIVSESRLVISHAGMGAMMEAVKHSKPIIVVPRRCALGEVGNDHQLTTAKQLESEGKVLVAYETSELPDKLRAAEGFVPSRGGGGQEIIRAVEAFIQEVQMKKFSRGENG